MMAPPSDLALLEPGLAELLLELSIGVHRFGMYPPGHPIVISLGDRLARRINGHTATHGPLTIGVAGKQLIVGEAATDPTQPILRELAKKARERGIGGLTLLPQLAAVDVELLLAVLSEEPDETSEGPPADTDRVRYLPIGYDSLDLAHANASLVDATHRATDLWLGMARSVIANGTIEIDDAGDIAGLADNIREKRSEEGYDQVILGYMAQLAGVLTEPGGGEGTRVIKAQFSQFLNALDKDTLREILQNGGGNDTNIRFAFDVCRSLDPTTAMKVLEAIPRTEGRRISHQLMRLLKKMAIKADHPSDLVTMQSQDAFRTAVERLSEEWDLEPPNPDEYDKILERMVSHQPMVGSRSAKDSLGVDNRIVLIASEVGSVGAAVVAAVERLSKGDGLRFLLQIAENTPRDDAVGAYVRTVVHSPQLISTMAKGGDMDEEALDSVIERLGLAAIEPLMEGLSTSPSRSVRRIFFDRLKGMGLPAGLAAVTRLENQPWYVLRNLLVLAQALEEIPQAIEVLRYMDHEDYRVRREALPVCLKVAEARIPALRAALADDDGRLVRMALAELRDELPGALVADVRSHVRKGGDLAVQGIRCLGASSAPLALKSLLDVCASRGLLGRPRLPRKSDHLLAALEELRRSWHTVHEARQVLNLAHESRDPEIRAAAGADE